MSERDDAQAHRISQIVFTSRDAGVRNTGLAASRQDLREHAHG